MSDYVIQPYGFTLRRTGWEWIQGARVFRSAYGELSYLSIGGALVAVLALGLIRLVDHTQIAGRPGNQGPEVTVVHVAPPGTVRHIESMANRPQPMSSGAQRNPPRH